MSQKRPQFPVGNLMRQVPPLIPVLHVEDPDHAEPLLGALISAGIRMIEVTLRTQAAPEVIRRMVAMNTDAIIGAGTITRAEQFGMVTDAGAMFGVSPAFTRSLGTAAQASRLPFVPGVATPSEALAAREAGFYELKFFPAELLGAIRWLRHVEPLFNDLRFCPTAGVDASNARDFLACPNVFAVGGAFLAPRDRIEAADWRGITVRASMAIGNLAH